jgi:hypothetical protein
MGVIEGGTAVLFAIVIYAIFYGLAGTQVRKLLVADEEPVVRILGFFGIAFVALMVWAIVGAFVYWGILIWFRIWLRDPHPWRQDILSATGWFPFGLLYKYGHIPAGGIRAVLILLGFPVALLLAGGVVAVGLRIQTMLERPRVPGERGSDRAGLHQAKEQS